MPSNPHPKNPSGWRGGGIYIFLDGVCMTTEIRDPAWDSLTYEQKNKLLYERQKKMLEEFLERGAISKQQFEKSLHDLTEKMKNNDNNLCADGRV